MSRAGSSSASSSRPLENDAAFGLGVCHGDSRVEEGHVRRRLGQARSHMRLRRRPWVWHRSIRLASSSAAKPPNTTEWIAPMPGARKHRDHRLGNHRHVDDHPVAALDSLLEQRPANRATCVAQLPVGERRSRLRDRRVVDQRKLVCPTTLDVSVKSVVAGVQAAAGEPAIERRPRIVEHQLPRLDPVDRRCGLGPELLRGIQRAPIDLLELDHHASLPSARLNRGPPEPIAELESSQQSCRFG